MMIRMNQRLLYSCTCNTSNRYFIQYHTTWYQVPGTRYGTGTCCRRNNNDTYSYTQKFLEQITVTIFQRTSSIINMLRSPSATLPLSPLNGGAASSSFYVSSQLVDSAVQAYFDGDFELSLKSLTTALKTQQLTLGDVDIVVAHTLGNIGTVYIAMGLLEEAMHVLQESLNIKMTPSPPQ